MKTAAIRVTGPVICLCLAAGMAFAADAPKAPQPAKPVDAASFYAGRWYEIGRTPKSFNKDCVAGYTDYQTKSGALSERDGCHDKTPDGKEELLDGQMRILNPAENTKVHATYHAMFGLLPINREYWVLDHTDGWAIMASPDMTDVSLYTRDPRPAPELVEKMTKEVKDMGYAGQLEFPAESAAKQ
ncbi:MAG TPA: lipocalin family protein [Rhizomicrobium sp.]|jgi:apolipoprotein D and lipocalin family protein|nr:lipocalin family protein [Rhizomicrobium sp.]